MKLKILKLLPFALPFLIMVLVNELYRGRIHSKPYSRFGITAMNSNSVLPNRCTWNCHDITTYCLQHHVSLLRPVLPVTNRIYFGTIYLLFLTGNYGMANIILYVILWPLLLYVLFLKILKYRAKTNSQ
jgi:hypothetical protein